MKEEFGLQAKRTEGRTGPITIIRLFFHKWLHLVKTIEHKVASSIYCVSGTCWYAQGQTRKAELYVLREQVGILYRGRGVGAAPVNFFSSQMAVGTSFENWSQGPSGSIVTLFLSRKPKHSV